MFQEPSTPSPTPLSPSRLKTLEETLSKQREAHGEPPPSPSGDFLGAHKSPFRKARRHFKNFVGGNVKPPRHTSQIIVSSSLSFIFIFYFCFFVSSNSVFLEIWRFMKDLNGKIDPDIFLHGISLRFKWSNGFSYLSFVTGSLKGKDHEIIHALVIET